MPDATESRIVLPTFLLFLSLIRYGGVTRQSEDLLISISL